MKRQMHNRHDITGWRILVAELRRRDTISAEEVAKLVKQHSGATADYALRRLQHEGVLHRPDKKPRGLYIVSKGSTKAFIGNPFEAVRAICGSEVVFGYGTALYLHGLSRYGRLSEYFVAWSRRRNKQSVDGIVIRFIQTPFQEKMGSSVLRRGRTTLRVTDLERTLIDCIHRPKYAQGWENVVHALDRAKGINGSRMIEYVKQYRTPSLVAKVGLILEHFGDRWKVLGAALNSLRPYLPRTPVKFSRGSGGSLNKDWNIFVPDGVFHE
jgi:predicted transcriptional regulator of viral defense system